MKRIIPIAILAMLFFASCEYDPYDHEPIADFSVDYNLVIPGEVIKFTNNSNNATRYEWDFGDGIYSTVKHPSHYFENEGVYEVSLTAYNGNYIDRAFMTVEVYETTLEVEVRDWDTDELIPRANVVLYNTEDEYLDFYNEVAFGVSDYDGIVVFKGVRSKSYYIDVYNSSYTNFPLYLSDIDFVRTAPLSHAMHNVFIAWVEYDPVMMKSASAKKLNVRDFEIKVEKRSFKDKQVSK